MKMKIFDNGLNYDVFSSRKQPKPLIFQKWFAVIIEPYWPEDWPQRYSFFYS